MTVQDVVAFNIKN